MKKQGIRMTAAALAAALVFAWGGEAAADNGQTAGPGIAGISVPLDYYYANQEDAENSLSAYLSAQELPVRPTDSHAAERLGRLGFDRLLMSGDAETYAALHNVIGKINPITLPTEPSTEESAEVSTEEPTEASTEESTEAPTEAETSPYNNIAVTEISIVDSFVHVRTEPSTQTGEIVGRIYNHCAATILDRVEGENGLWYKIESGNVEGYIKADYFVTGDEAEALALKIGKIFARVDAGGLRLREEPVLDGDNIITNLWEGEIYAVMDPVKSTDQFVHITLGKDDAGNDVSGYVSKQYVTVYVEFDTALTLGEIQAIADAKKKAEEAAAEAARKAEAEKKAAEDAEKKAQAAREEEERKKAEAAAAEAAANAAMATRNALVSYAKQFLGVPYVWGGESLTNGVDCSGLTMKVYAQYGYSLPHYSVFQAEYGTRIGLDALRPGDLIFYARGGVIYHVAIYIGDGQILHAANESLGVCISSMNYADVYCAVSILP